MIRWMVTFETADEVVQAVVDTRDDGTFIEAIAHARYSVPDDFRWSRVVAERMTTTTESFG